MRSASFGDMEVTIGGLECVVTDVALDFDYYRGRTPAGGPDPSNLDFSHKDFDWRSINVLDGEDHPGLASRDATEALHRLLFDKLEERMSATAWDYLD